MDAWDASEKSKLTPDAIAVPAGYVPSKCGDVLELDMGDGIILYNHDSSLVHHLNPSAGIVWHLCDGVASVGELARVITEEYRLSAGEILAQVTGLIAELDALGLVQDAAAPPPGPAA